jgi:hypothetical protein
MASFAALTPAFLLHKADADLSEGDARALARLLHAVDERDVSGEQTRPALLLAKNVLGVLVTAIDARPPAPQADEDDAADDGNGMVSPVRGRRTSPLRPGPTARAMSPDPAEPKSFVDADELLPTSVHSFGDENARPDDALSLEDLRGKCDALVKRNTRLEGDLKAAMKELGAARMRKKAEGVPMDLRSTKHLEEELETARSQLASALEDGARTKKELAEMVEFATGREAERLEQVRRLAREGAEVAKKELADDVKDAGKRASKQTEASRDLAARAAAGISEALAVNAMLERRLVKERDGRVRAEAAAGAATRILAFKRVVEFQMRYVSLHGEMPMDPPLDSPHATRRAQQPRRRSYRSVCAVCWDGRRHGGSARKSSWRNTKSLQRWSERRLRCRRRFVVTSRGRTRERRGRNGTSRRSSCRRNTAGTRRGGTLSRCVKRRWARRRRCNRIFAGIRLERRTRRGSRRRIGRLPRS